MSCSLPLRGTRPLPRCLSMAFSGGDPDSEYRTEVNRGLDPVQTLMGWED